MIPRPGIRSLAMRLLLGAAVLLYPLPLLGQRGGEGSSPPSGSADMGRSSPPGGSTLRALDALYRKSRREARLGILSRADDARLAHFMNAEELAREATALDPKGLEGLHLTAVAMGLQVDHVGQRERIRLAQEVGTLALDILRRDSLHASAHHILGRLYAGSMRLNGFSRFLARRVLGGNVLGEASWEEAESHLRRAEELQPAVLIHHLELGILYLSTQRWAEALEEMEHVLSRPARHAVDVFYQQRAGEIRNALLAGEEPPNPSSRLKEGDPPPPLPSALSGR